MVMYKLATTEFIMLYCKPCLGLEVGVGVILLMWVDTSSLPLPFIFQFRPYVSNEWPPSTDVLRFSYHNLESGTP